MLTLFSRTKPLRTEAGVVVRNSVTVHTQQLVQTQYLSEHYVLTDVGRMLLLFWPERGQRLVVDRARRELKALDLSPQAAQAAQLRTALGGIRIECPEGEEEVGGYSCRRLLMHNENATIVVQGEIWCARVPELADTALGKEREFDTTLQPFVMPLAADEIAVRSTMRMLAQAFEQNQRTELLGVDRAAEDFAELDGILTYKLVA